MTKARSKNSNGTVGVWRTGTKVTKEERNEERDTITRINISLFTLQQILLSNKRQRVITSVDLNVVRD